MTSHLGPLVSPEWLAANLENPDLVVLDVRMPVVTATSAPRAERDPARIPGARIFDIEAGFSDPSSSLPHTMPTAKDFEQAVRALGINQDSLIVAYDHVGIYSSPRCWWMFRAMGHERVAVLDGGMPAWLAAGNRSEPAATVVSSKPGNFVARPRPGHFRGADEVQAALDDRARQVVLDARSAGRFEGRDPEPRPGLRSGHMPGAVSLPFGDVLAQGRMRDVDQLKAIFAAKAGARRELVFSCGSGVTSCVLALAAELAGYSDLHVYDGSWSEWGLPSARPVVTGKS